MVNGRFAEITQIRRLSEVADHLDELRAVMATAAGRPPQYDGLDFSHARVEFEALFRHSLERAKKQFGEDDLRTCAALAQLGSNLLAQLKYADAEPLLRECLETRQQKQPYDWATFNAKSMLGGNLLGTETRTQLVSSPG
jgi:hypothetical protein